MTKPIAIFNNGCFARMEPGFYRACGGDQDAVFAAAAGLPASAVVDIDVEGGADLPDASAFSGVILTGSEAMVTDRLPWAEAEAAWVRRHRSTIPMLGVCFGHQLLAHALGGTVGYNATGPEYGSYEVAMTAIGRSDALFAGVPDRFMAQSAHSQCVLRLPGDAVALATGLSGVQAARFDDQIWGLQFHPEFGLGMMQGMFEHYRNHALFQDLNVDRLTRDLQDTRHTFGFVSRFTDYCARRTLAMT